MEQKTLRIAQNKGIRVNLNTIYYEVKYTTKNNEL